MTPTDLQHAREEATSLDRHVFEGERRRKTPLQTRGQESVGSLAAPGTRVTHDAAHGDTEQCTDTEERAESGHVGRCEGKGTADEAVGNERPLAAVTVAEQTEDDGAEGTEEQGEGETSRDSAERTVEVDRQAVVRESNGEKVCASDFRGSAEASYSVCTACSPIASTVHAIKPDRNSMYCMNVNDLRTVHRLVEASRCGAGQVSIGQLPSAMSIRSRADYSRSLWEVAGEGWRL